MRFWISLLTVLTIVACGSDPVATRSSTTTTEGVPAGGFVTGNLTCATGLVDYGTYDYPEGATGHKTIRKAMEDFRTWEEWQLRPDWHTLTPDDLSDSPVTFTDDRGWVYLSVTLIPADRGWLISGYQSCEPDGS